MYLIDTDVLSSLAKKNRDPRIVRWLESKRTADLYLSVVSIAEIESKLSHFSRRSVRSARGMATWLDSLTGLYGDRILGVDLAIARRWGQLSSNLAFDGADLLVAATALEKGLTLVTLRVPLFRPTGVPTADPSAVMVVA